MCNFAIGKSSAKTIVAKNTKNSFIMNFFGTGFVSKFFYIFIIGKKSGIFLYLSLSVSIKAMFSLSLLFLDF